MADVTIPETPVTGDIIDLDVANVAKFTLPNDIFVFPPPEPIGAYNNEAFAWDKYTELKLLIAVFVSVLVEYTELKLLIALFRLSCTLVLSWYPVYKYDNVT